MIVYGIPNCDTVKKARKWLQANNIVYQFHDFRKDGLDATLLNAWVKNVGWETLLNRRGMTWRKLSDSDKNNIDQTKAVKLMLEQVTLIKRPVLVKGNTVLVGFDESKYQQLAR